MVAQLTPEQLIEKLNDDDPQVRIRAMRRLAATGQIEAVTAIADIYNDVEESTRVRKVAAEALGVFKAIKEAVDNEQPVDLPDPSDVPEPSFSPEFLRRIIQLLGILLVILVLVNALVFVVGRLPERVSGLISPDATPEELVLLLQARAAQVRADVIQQEQSWHEYAGVQVFSCDKYTATSATSIAPADLIALSLDETTQPELYEANNVLIQAINAFILPNNNWVLGCATGDAPAGVTTEMAMADLAGITVLLDEVDTQLAEAQNILFVETPTVEADDATLAPTNVVETPMEAEPTVVLEPTIASTPLAYRPYIGGMREKVDAAISGRGVATLLQQYWTDVVSSGQSFGCRQPFNDSLIQEDYTRITPAIAAIDPRLLAIQERINLGLQLTRESLALFQQGCSSGTFIDPANNGQAQANYAVDLLQQASVLLDDLQAQVATESP